MSTTLPDSRRGRWIPWVFVGGMGLVVAVNAVLIAASVSTFTGTTTGRAYDRGRAYNHVLDEAERQRALGWQAEVRWRDGAVVVAARGRDGVPLPAGSTVSGALLRPLEGTRLPLEFLPVGGGVWAAPAAPPAPGQWEARLTVAEGARRLELRQRLLLP